MGFATPPSFVNPPESDGMVIAYQYFGTIGTAVNSQPNHLGRTTTHEMGHYFNLEHVWGPDQGGCNEDDFVNDTPNQQSESVECPTFPQHDNCTTSGNGIMFNNYLDYSDDDCMTMFTEGQKMRMLAALNGPRASLLTSNGCSAMTSTVNVVYAQPNIFPNPANERVIISLPEGSFQNDIYSIHSLAGEKMLEFRIEDGKNEIDLGNFPFGIYFLTSTNNLVAPQKFIVSK